MRRRLGLTSAAALVVANMIGAGVFTTSGFALADLGRPETVLLAWVVGGLIALCGALSYGALARRIPESGGETSRKAPRKTVRRSASRSSAKKSSTI